MTPTADGDGIMLVGFKGRVVQPAFPDWHGQIVTITEDDGSAHPHGRDGSGRWRVQRSDGTFGRLHERELADLRIAAAPAQRTDGDKAETPDESWFACLTGDCPHDTQLECDTWIRAELLVLAKEAHRLRAQLSSILADRRDVTLRQLQRINSARKDAWHADATRPWSTLEWAGAMCGEAGEAANVAKKLLRIELGTPGNEASEHRITEADELRRKFGGELAGTVLYAALAASDVGLDLEEIIVHEFDRKSDELGFDQRLRPTPTEDGAA